MPSYIINEWIDRGSQRDNHITIFCINGPYPELRKMLETNERQRLKAKRHFFIRDEREPKRMNELKNTAIKYKLKDKFKRTE